MINPQLINECSQIPRDCQLERLKLISEFEQLSIENQAFDELIRVAEGDLRLAINLLQAASHTKQTMTRDVIIEASGVSSVSLTV